MKGIKRIVGIFICILIFSAAGAQAKDILSDDFSADEGIFRDTDCEIISGNTYGVIKALKIYGDSVSALSYIDIEPTYLLNQPSNPAVAASQEGADCMNVTSFDICFDKLMENKASTEFRLSMASNTDNTSISRVIFNGADGKIQISQGPTELLDCTEKNFLEDGKWYRIKIVLRATDSAGNGTGTLDIFCNGVPLVQRAKFQSTSVGKVDAYDKLTLATPNSRKSVMYLGNFKIYKYNSQDPFNDDLAISEMRLANELLDNAVIGNGETEYDSEVYNNFKDLLELKTSLPSNQEEADRLYEEIHRAIELFVPNGRPINAEEITFKFHRYGILMPLSNLSMANDTIAEARVSASNKLAGKKNVILAVYAVKNGETTEFNMDKQTIIPGNECKLSATLNLEKYTKSEKADMDIKCVIITDDGINVTSAPQYWRNEQVLEIDYPSFSDEYKIENKYFDDGRVRTDFFVKGDGIHNLLVTDNEENIYYAGQEEGKDNNPAVLCVSLLEDGIYNYLIDGVYSGTFVYCSTDRMNEILAEIKQAGTNRTEKIKEYKDFIGLEGIYSYAEECGILMDAVVEAAYSGGFSPQNFSELSKRLSDETAAAILSECGTITSSERRTRAVNLAVEQLAGEVRVLDTNKQTAFETAIMAEDVTVDNAGEKISKAYFIADLYCAVNTDEIKTAIERNAGILNVYSEYYALSAVNKAKVNSLLYENRKNITSFVNFNNQINNAIISVKAQSNNAAGGGGSSGGGSSGGSSGGGSLGGGSHSAYIPLQSANEENVPVQKTPLQLAKEMYSDLDTVPWAEEAIAVLTSEGVLSGVGDGKFNPNEAIKREECIKIAVCLFGLLDEEAETNFTDVQEDAWYAAYIASAQKLGFINGVGEGRFGIGEPIRRMDLASILYKFACNAGVEFAPYAEYIPFDDDNSIPPCVHEAIAALARSNVVIGSDANLFLPRNSCTRAEAASMVYRLMKLMRQ